MEADGTSTPLQLTEFVAGGNDRECWRHPLDPSLCVKVAKPTQERAQNEIDFHYGTHLVRRQVVGSHLPRMHGWVQTNRGPGLVFDLVQEPDGTPSPPLFDALSRGLITPGQAVAIVNEAFDWLASQRVILADYGRNNLLVCQRADGTCCLVFVDGLGARNFGLQYWARRVFAFKSRKKIEQFRRKTLLLIAAETQGASPARTETQA